MAFDYPSSPVLNQVYNAPTGQGYVWNGTAWNLAQTSPQAPVASDNPPANPYNGQLWLRSTTGALYMWYVDPNSSQWIQIPGVFTPGGVSGVTDGSNAAAGIVGEFITVTGTSTAVSNGAWVSVSGTQIVLAAGDWEVWGSAFINPTAAAITSTQLGIATAANSAASQQNSFYLTGASISQLMLATPRVRFNISASTSVFLNVYVSFSSGTCTVLGWIYARRMR